MEETIPSPRKPVLLRAGSAINHDRAVRITVHEPTRLVVHGLFDRASGIYQGGGDASKFIYRKRDWVTLDERVWAQLKDEPLCTIEIVDHETNTVYRIPEDEFAFRARRYDAGGRPRVGVPRKYWQHLDADGHLLSGPEIYDGHQPE